MATYQRGKYWWYRFRFAGERIDEPTKSTSRTVAKEAKRQHRRSLEAGYNNFKEVRQNRVRTLEEIIEEYLTGYRLRYRSASFAEYPLGHVSRLLGTKIVADITEISVLRYQEDRLRAKAAPKSINEEVRFLLKMLGDPGEVIRAHLKKTKQLKLTVHKRIGKAYDTEETESLANKAKSSRSPCMFRPSCWPATEVCEIPRSRPSPGAKSTSSRERSRSAEPKEKPEKGESSL
jgi:hypothetical protein